MPIYGARQRNSTPARERTPAVASQFMRSDNGGIADKVRSADA
jgi:hypothetical protein